MKPDRAISSNTLETMGEKTMEFVTIGDPLKEIKARVRKLKETHEEEKKGFTFSRRKPE